MLQTDFLRAGGPGNFFPGLLTDPLRILLRLRADSIRFILRFRQYFSGFVLRLLSYGFRYGF